MTHKKLVSVVAFMLLASLCLFAERVVLSSTNFKLKHVVNVSADFHFEFYNPETNKSMTEATMDSAGRHVFSTLVIIYNTQITLKSISVEFSDLVNTEDPTIFYPYTMEVLKPNSTDHYAEITPTANKHGAGSCVLFNRNTSFSKYSPAVWDTDEVCDFAITLDDTDVPYGTYAGTIKYTFTQR
ncbi:MAG: hypothetical protein MJ057_06080 [Sphaerochaetaceae bacterium]|nr:hypothetical protein [Sphaerochaetaceae bacterium]